MPNADSSAPSRSPGLADLLKATPAFQDLAQHLADGAAQAVVAFDAILEQLDPIVGELHALIGSERLHEDTAGHVRGILQALASARIETRAARESVLQHGVSAAKVR